MSGFSSCLVRKITKFRIIIVYGCLFLIVGFSISILQLAVISEHPTVGNNHSNRSVIQSVGYDRDQFCQFPVLNPFDRSILPYVKHPPPLFCQRVQPEFTYMEGNWLNIDFSLARRHRFETVYYRRIGRKNESHIKYGEWNWWNTSTSHRLYLYEPTEVIGQYVLDIRKNRMTPKKYRNLHATVHLANNTENEKLELLHKWEEKRDGATTGDPLNVLIFGIDSLSRSNFIRNLPKTYSFLTESMGSIDLRGYTKIDDNTFPNILAVLTGRKVTIHGSELTGHFQRDHVDHYPFIWKNYSANGYVTGLAEEQPGVLSYKAKGFRDVPVDWYLRPFGVALERSPLRKYSSPDCVGNTAESKIILQSIDRFLISRQNSSLPYFLFSFLWKLSHDQTSDVESIDHIIAHFFQRLFINGHFNNTIVFVMSDHGNRFDTIRRTLIGRYEERMPYLSIYLPDHFRQNYPMAVENLKKNVWRLTCQYDIYETLVDIVNREYGDVKRERLKNRGYSLFTPVPKTRTCEEANISPHFCVCQKEENLNMEQSWMVPSAAERILREINDRLLVGKEVKGLCSKLKLKRVLAAQKYKASDSVKYALRWHFNKLLTERNVTGVVSHLRVSFITSPNQAIYEGLVRYLEGRTHFDDATVVDISRIDPYGHQGDCVSKIDRNLEKFCFCGRGAWFG